MSPWGRAGLGALLGALITLVIHPISRPFLLSAATRTSKRAIQGCLDRYAAKPPPPRNLRDASLWMQLAADRIFAKQEFRPSELRTLHLIAQKAIAIDARNAFWPQMQAVLYQAGGQPEDARNQWARAARCDIWNDYQSDRLMAGRERIARRFGSEQAWQLAYVYRERTMTPAMAIERYARTVLSSATGGDTSSMMLRYETLMNGVLIRLGSRSVATGVLGANLVELSSYPSNLVKTPSPKRLWLAQSKFVQDLGSRAPDRAAYARNAFAKNESWLAITQSHDPQDLIEELSTVAVISATLIGASATVALAGLLVWLIGRQVTVWIGHEPRLLPKIVIPTAIVIAAIATLLTRDLWSGIVGILAGWFLMFGPQNVRRSRPEDIGPFFGFLIVVIGTLCGLAVAGFAVVKTPAASTLLPYLGIPTDFYSTPLLLGMAWIFLSIALCAFPIWAMVQRLGTPHVLGLGLRKLGAFMGIGGLTIGILLGPAAVYIDRRISHTLTELVENESIYYILQ